MNCNFWEVVRLAPEGETGETPPEQQVEGQEGQEEEEVTQEQEAPKPQMVPVDVMQRRIAAITKQKADLQRELELAKLAQVPVGDERPQAPQASQAEINRQAAILAAEMDFAKRTQAVTEAGLKMSPDFNNKIVEMMQLHGDLPPHFIEAVMEAGDTHEGAAKLIYGLAQDPVKAASILGMSPARQAVALTKLQAEAEAKKAPKEPKRKDPPPPITPKIGAGSAPAGTVDLYDSKTPIEDWMAAREKEARAARRRF